MLDKISSIFVRTDLVNLAPLPGLLLHVTRVNGGHDFVKVRAVSVSKGRNDKADTD